MIMLLGYGLCPAELKVYWLLPGKSLYDGLRIISSDEDTLVMRSVADKVKNFVLYFDHMNHVGSTDWDDIVVNSKASLPKVLSPRIIIRSERKEGERMSDFYMNLPSSSTAARPAATQLAAAQDDSESSGEDSDFYDSSNEVEDGDDDLFIHSVDEDEEFEGNKAYDTPVEEPSDEELELPEDSDGEGGVRYEFKTFNPEDMSNPTFKLGMVF
ncbi:hypothetical protein GQ55_6G147600 [Panicum hallii var. hallii]|uniref:Uncharacterized protein n=1 Tax=Panicum hallii var. hallii TaxID=1504633 RepID=A0A2T7D698_9POAL|nr:hypothetical protein GQ55_6G147600 [Panicum hallii var. hallii]